MFRSFAAALAQTRCFPRMRGDVPNRLREYLKLRQFSPHARGCSFVAQEDLGILVVFPACAGMFLCI